ncbi:MAG TPA: hypothetical protein VGN57_16375 [Pirellulaceae bacterium]|nr:hypothetical protein [Pirellulaceae bacterium]
MTDLSAFPEPLLVAIAGPNGAGKSTFYHSQLARFGLPFVNADELAADLRVDAYAAADVAEIIRQSYVRQRISFAFETVLSDPVGEKVSFLEGAAVDGYAVLLFFVGIPDAATSKLRVKMRTMRGGHDVPEEKLRERYPRTLANLRRAIQRLPYVFIQDNSLPYESHRPVARFEAGKAVWLASPIPDWLKPCLPDASS